MAETTTPGRNLRRRPAFNAPTWARKLLESSRHEFQLLIAAVPLHERELVGQRYAWSAKDEIAHLAFWIETFARNVHARREGRPLIDTGLYQALNDAAWHERKDWTWPEVESALAEAFVGLDAQLAALSAAELIVAGQFTVEPERAAPRPVMRSLLYEVVDHPCHHFAGLYRRFGSDAQLAAAATRLSAAVEAPSQAKWTAPTRRKLRLLGA